MDRTCQNSALNRAIKEGFLRKWYRVEPGMMAKRQPYYHFRRRKFKVGGTACAKAQTVKII